MMAATDLVPDDIVYLRLEDVVPADLRVTDGQMQVDQSQLTGHSVGASSALMHLAMRMANASRATCASTRLQSLSVLTGGVATARSAEATLRSPTRCGGSN